MLPPPAARSSHGAQHAQHAYEHHGQSQRHSVYSGQPRNHAVTAAPPPPPLLGAAARCSAHAHAAATRARAHGSGAPTSERRGVPAVLHQTWRTDKLPPLFEVRAVQCHL